MKEALVRQADIRGYKAPRFQILKGKAELKEFCRSGHSRIKQFSIKHIAARVFF